MSLLYLSFMIDALPFTVPAFSLWLCLWFSSDELFFGMEVLRFFFQVRLSQGEACVLKQRARVFFAFHSSSSLWDQILLSDESDTVGTAAPQPDGQETSADTSVKHIFVPTVGCFSPMGKPENSWPTCNASAPVLHGNQPAAQLRLHRSFQDVTVFLVIAVSFGAKPAPDQDNLWCPSAFELS